MERKLDMAVALAVMQFNQGAGSLLMVAGGGGGGVWWRLVIHWMHINLFFDK